MKASIPTGFMIQGTHSMGRAKEIWADMLEEASDHRLAEVLNITYEELSLTDWTLIEDQNDDGFVFGYYVEFGTHSSPEVLQKIEGIEDGRVYLAPGVLDDSTMYEELEWEIRSSEHFEIFKAQLDSAEALLQLDLPEGVSFNLKVMLHAHIIAAIERYLSAAFIQVVINSEDLIRRLVESDPELGKRQFSLKEIFSTNEKLKLTVATYLRDLIFHDLRRIKPMYSAVLGFKFGDIGWLFKAVQTRHDCVHRAGYDKDGNIVEISGGSIVELTLKSRELVEAVEKHLREMSEEL